MKYCLLLIAAVLCVPGVAHGQSDEDRDAVREAVLNYVEGFYEGDSTKIAMGVYPEVNKRGFYMPRDSEEYEMSPMSYEQMFEYVRGVQNRQNFAPDDAPRDIEIYDIMDQTASVKLTAFWGSDYMLLAKRDGEWKIWQVLWQTPTPDNP